MKKYIIHVSEIDITREGGMGRVEYYWGKSFENKDIDFVHIGPAETGKLLHRSLFPYKAYNFYKKLNITADAFIIHESASGCFVNRGVPCFVESHGLERRLWDLSSDPLTRLEKIPLKTRIFHPFSRLYNCDKGLKNADKLLLINSDDKMYAMKKYYKSEADIFIFKNGVISPISDPTHNNSNIFTVLFNGTWISRKGIQTLIKCADLLFKEQLIINYLLIGTGISADTVLKDWPEYLRPFVSVVPQFNHEDEAHYLNRANAFVLPSFYEGQPLSLLQAMAAGKCCVTTNCCGQKDIIEHCKNGLLFTPGDHTALYLLLKDCYDRPDMVNSIGKEAARSVASRVWNVVADEVADYVLKNI